ncbi:MAG: GNAT family N-acetyltransferase [Pseudomonadota bacterium]
MTIALRVARDDDAGAASALVQTSFVALAAHDWSPQAKATFLARTAPVALRGEIAQAAFAGAAFEGARMVGFLLMPEPALVGILFVDPQYLRRKIAAALWTQAREHIVATFHKVNIIELNATPFAVEFYRAMGFVAVSPECVLDGHRATRMAYRLPASR